MGNDRKPIELKYPIEVDGKEVSTLLFDRRIKAKHSRGVYIDLTIKGGKTRLNFDMGQVSQIIANLANIRREEADEIDAADLMGDIFDQVTDFLSRIAQSISEKSESSPISSDSLSPNSGN